MSKEYKQLIKAYMSYAFGFWVTSYLWILFSSLFSETEIKTRFSGAYGLIGGIFLIAFVAVFSSIPFYIWIGIREAMLKEKLNTQGLYKCAFFAGLVCPLAFCLILWSLIALSLRNDTFYIIVLLSIIAVLAEICIKLNKKSHNKADAFDSATASQKI
jgi:hypothetical protein